MIPSFTSFLTCLRRATSWPQRRVCVTKYHALDWLTEDLYVHNQPVRKRHCMDPIVHTVSFSDADQCAYVGPGMVSMLDGATRVGRRTLHLNQIMMLHQKTAVESIHPFATLLYVAHTPIQGVRHPAASPGAFRTVMDSHCGEQGQVREFRGHRAI